MTRTEMEQLRSIPAEIKSIEEQLKSPQMEWVNVFYKDYRSGVGVPRSITELDYDHEEWDRLRAKLTEKRERLRDLIFEAENFIDSIDSSRMRTIIRMYYINRKTQGEIGEELFYTSARIGQLINEFWAQQEADPDE